LAADNRAEAYRLLALEIRAAFLDLALQAEEIRLAEFRLGVAHLEQAGAETAWRRGEITEEEAAWARLVAGETELRLDRLTRERANARADFVRLTGWTDPEGLRDPEGFPVLELGPENEAGGRLGTGGYLPWRGAARGRVQQAAAQYQLERARDRPRLGLIAGVAQDQVAVFDRSDINRTILFGGVELTWTIFDGFESQGRRSAAMARRRLEEARWARQEEEWKVGLVRLGEAVAGARRELSFAQARLRLGERDLGRREADFEQG
jgi:outer membrane protein TolC